MFLGRLKMRHFRYRVILELKCLKYEVLMHMKVTFQDESYLSDSFPENFAARISPIYIKSVS